VKRLNYILCLRLAQACRQDVEGNGGHFKGQDEEASGPIRTKKKIPEVFEMAAIVLRSLREYLPLRWERDGIPRTESSQLSFFILHRGPPRKRNTKKAELLTFA